MYIENTKQMLGKIFTFFKIGDGNFYSKIYLHWQIILMVFLIAGLLLIGFSLYLFFQINEEGIFLVEQTQEVRVDSIDRKTLQELIVSFEVKDILFEERKITPPTILDPSI
jgi:hypothetical protein